MPKLTKATALMKAAHKVENAQRRVANAKRALTLAEKAADKADEAYMDLASEALAARQQSRERQEEQPPTRE